KRALREAANAANAASWGYWESYKPHKGARGYEVKVGVKAVAQHCLKVDSVFIAAAYPATVLALLDELEALKLANAAQDDHINQQQDRIDLLEKGNNEAARQINSWRRLAKQNIAEREKDVSELNIARKRIAELEAREKSLRTVGVMSQKAFQRLEGRESRFIALWPRPEIYLPRKRPDDGVIVYARVAGAGKGEAS
ncbi:ead/Ea22-like family protein, partial [Enterobacter hormaechei]